MAGKFQRTFYVQAYQLAQAGHDLRGICDGLGVNYNTLKKWRTKNPAFNQAIDDGYKAMSVSHDSEKFSDYIFDNLAPENQAIWEEIRINSTGSSILPKGRAAMMKASTAQQQRLYLYAYTSTTFSASKALTKLGLPKATLDKWTKDEDFQALLAEVDWHKKNFFEDALISEVYRGETAAITFVAKTQLRDRGYGERLDLGGTLDTTTKHSLDFSDLGLPADIQRAILDAIREKQGADNAADASS